MPTHETKTNGTRLAAMSVRERVGWDRGAGPDTTR